MIVLGIPALKPRALHVEASDTSRGHCDSFRLEILADTREQFESVGVNSVPQKNLQHKVLSVRPPG